MADFPDDIFTPREVANREGVEYDAEKTKVFFAEDHNILADELVAVEETLGLNPEGDATTVGDRIEDLEKQIDFVSGGKIYNKLLTGVTNSVYFPLVAPDDDDVDDTCLFVADITLCTYNSSGPGTMSRYLVRYFGAYSPDIIALYEGGQTRSPRLFDDSGVMKVKLNSHTGGKEVMCLVTCYDFTRDI